MAAFRSLRTHPDGVSELWQWLKSNWDKLANGPASIIYSYIIRDCSSGFATYDQLREVEEFFAGKDTIVSVWKFFFFAGLYMR